MKKALISLLLCLLAVPSAFAGEQSHKKDWGHLTGSLESNNHFYVEDAANDFYPSMQPQLKDGKTFASNDYLKLDYFKGSLSAGMQLEGYFPSLVGFPISESVMSLSNLYLTWRDKSYSVTAGTFYEQLGSGLLFRSWEDRMLGLNNAMLGARATYNFQDKISVRAFWGIPRLGKVEDNVAMMGFERKFFGLGLAKGINVAAADLSVSLSNIFDLGDVSLSVEGSILNKSEDLGAEFIAAGCRKNNIGWSGRVNFDLDGLFVRGEYVDAGMQIASVSDVYFGDKAHKGNAQILEFGYNKRGLGVTFTGRRLERMNQKIYAYDGNQPGYFSPVNMLSYIPALCTQYTYMLSTLNPYGCELGDDALRTGEIGGQIDAFYNFRRGTTLGGKRGMKVHANFSSYYALDPQGKANGKDCLFRDFSFDVEKQWTKKFKTVLLYSLQNYKDNQKHNYDSGNLVGKAHIFVADLLYKWTPTFSTRMELQYLSSKDDQGDWMAGLVEFNLAPHWSIFASDMWNHGFSKLHYYNGGLSYTYEHIRVAAGYGRYKAGFICSGGVCREIPAYTGANLTLTASF